ncbi:MAG: helix-turn-helix transcriptional regulator [Rectinemataceae bacterium]
MPPTVMLIALVLAFFSGPSAFLLLWLTYKKTEERSLRTLAFGILGLCLILIGNTAAWVRDNYTRSGDPRIGFLILNEVFLATVMMGAFLALFAHEITRTRVTLFLKTMFWAFSILFFFLVLSLPIFLSGPGIVNVDNGYLASTIFGTMCSAYATFVIIANRGSLVAAYRGFLPPFFAALMGLNVLSVLNDILHFGILLHGSNFPFSPFFFILTNISIAVLCTRELLHAKGAAKAPPSGTFPDLGLTEREKEIVPLIIEGLSNEDIAAKLFISPHTVKNHITNIFRKAGVANRFELLKRMTGSST